MPLQGVFHQFMRVMFVDSNDNNHAVNECVSLQCVGEGAIWA